MRRILAVALSVGAAAITLGCGDAAGADDEAPGGTSASASPAALDSALANSFQALAAPGGATAAVVDDGRLLWSGAVGRARVGRGGAMRPGSLFAIASTTKSVTAAMTMALAEDGEIDLDLPIASALPSLPGAKRITPRKLLNHSSGLQDYFADGDIFRIAARHPYHRWTRREVLAHVEGLRFQPGSRHGYSNSGYVTLGGLIERAAGESVDSYFQEQIAAPLGLGGSAFRYGAAPQRRFAHPLRSTRGGRLHDRFGRNARVPTDYWGGVWTDGGLATTAAGLAKIGNATYAGDLLAPASVKQMLPPKPGGWGLGTFDKAAMGRTWIGHDGSYGGYQTENWTDRPTGVTVTVATNGAGSGVLAPRIWRAVAAASLKDAL